MGEKRLCHAVRYRTLPFAAAGAGAAKFGTDSPRWPPQQPDLPSRLVVATANSLSSIPAAVRRPERFDEVVEVVGVGEALARSILAEALLNHMGEGRFRAYSAGSFPKGDVHPAALELLDELGFETAELRSKSWDEFSKPGAPVFDFIFTVCDNAASETCPIWPGHPATAHWGIEDPAAVEGEGQRQAFVDAMTYLKRRIDLLLALPDEEMEPTRWRDEVREIGRVSDGGSTRG